VNLTNSQWPNKNAQSALILILTTELSTVNSEMASSRYQYKASAPMQSTKNEGIDLRSFSCGSPKIVESPSIITEAPCEIAENRRIAVKNHRMKSPKIAESPGTRQIVHSSTKSESKFWVPGLPQIPTIFIVQCLSGRLYGLYCGITSHPSNPCLGLIRLTSNRVPERETCFQV